MTAQEQQPQPQDDGNSVNGEIAAVQGSTLQVQDSSQQTAVTYSDATTITAQVSGTIADIVVGSCVMATADAEDGTTEGTAFAASQVMVTPAAEDGSCSTGFGGGAPGGAGRMPTDMPTDMPSGGPGDGERPTDMPSDMPSDMPADGDFTMSQAASGQVTAVDGNAVTVTGTDRDGEEQTRTVTVSDATGVTTTVAADASALVVGQCVAARGEADDSGTLTAETLMVSSPGDDGCVTRGGGMMMGGPGGGRPGESDSGTSEN